jgi:hypothetical protein
MMLLAIRAYPQALLLASGFSVAQLLVDGFFLVEADEVVLCVVGSCDFNGLGVDLGVDLALLSLVAL